MWIHEHCYEAVATITHISCTGKVKHRGLVQGRRLPSTASQPRLQSLPLTHLGREAGGADPCLPRSGLCPLTVARLSHPPDRHFVGTFSQYGRGGTFLSCEAGIQLVLTICCGLCSAVALPSLCRLSPCVLHIPWRWHVEEPLCFYLPAIFLGPIKGPCY